VYQIYSEDTEVKFEVVEHIYLKRTKGGNTFADQTLNIVYAQFSPLTLRQRLDPKSK
jgi:hypothetical protein